MRIWFQKHITVGKVPALDAGYEKHARQLLRPDTEIVFHGVQKEAYEGSFPNQIVNYSYPETMFGNYFLSRIIEAEKTGYDAFIIGTAPDPGLRDAKSLVDIPVVGYSEASMHIASMLGTRFSYVGFVDMQDRHVDNAGIYGLRERLGPWGRVPVPAAVVQNALEGRPGPFLDAFYIAAREVIASGSNVIIPMEGLTNEILYHQGIHGVDGVPIVDSNGVVFKMAEMLDDLRKISGMMVTRKGYYHARPPAEMVERLTRLYGSK